MLEDDGQKSSRGGATKRRRTNTPEDIQTISKIQKTSISPKQASKNSTRSTTDQRRPVSSEEAAPSERDDEADDLESWSSEGYESEQDDDDKYTAKHVKLRRHGPFPSFLKKGRQKYRGVTQSKQGYGDKIEAWLGLGKFNKSKESAVGLGQFPTEEQAAEEYDRAFLATYGHEPQALNFPDRWKAKDWKKLEGKDLNDFLIEMRTKNSWRGSSELVQRAANRSCCEIGPWERYLRLRASETHRHWRESRRRASNNLSEFGSEDDLENEGNEESLRDHASPSQDVDRAADEQKPVRLGWQGVRECWHRLHEEQNAQAQFLGLDGDPQRLRPRAKPYLPPSIREESALRKFQRQKGFGNCTDYWQELIDVERDEEAEESDGAESDSSDTPNCLNCGGRPHTQATCPMKYLSREKPVQRNKKGIASFKPKPKTVGKGRSKRQPEHITDSALNILKLSQSKWEAPEDATHVYRRQPDGDSALALAVLYDEMLKSSLVSTPESI